MCTMPRNGQRLYLCQLFGIYLQLPLHQQAKIYVTGSELKYEQMQDRFTSYRRIGFARR